MQEVSLVLKKSKKMESHLKNTVPSEYLSNLYALKKEFSKEYIQSLKDPNKRKQYQRQIIDELEIALIKDDVEKFKKTCGTFALRFDEDTEFLFSFDDEAHPIQNTNIIISACKSNSLKILSNMLCNLEFISQLFSITRHILLPTDRDNAGHNVFYYSIRSGNIKFLEILISEWPDNYFQHNPQALEDILSEAYQELKLKNIVLSEEMDICIQDKLINLRFFSDSSQKNRQAKHVKGKVKERITFLLDCINLLNNMEDVNERFLYIARNITKSIDILKRQLKCTYDRIPWEEIEFCLLSFIACHSKIQGINLYYLAVLSKEKIMEYLNHFTKAIKKFEKNIEHLRIDELSVLPKINRNENIFRIIEDDSEFENLFNDYHQIRDIHTLKHINDYIRMALKVDSTQREGQLALLRSLQVIGEYFKNTLESPKLSTFTNDLLLSSLPQNTRKIIIDIRNSLTHAYSLSKRLDIEENSDVIFFSNIQNDLKKIGNVIDDILHKSRVKIMEAILKKYINAKSIDEVTQLSDTLKKSNLFEDMSMENFLTRDIEKLEALINDLKTYLPVTSQYQQEIFQEMDNILSTQKMGIPKMKCDFTMDTSLIILLCSPSFTTNIDESAFKALQYAAKETLKSINSTKTDPACLKRLGGLAVKLFDDSQPKVPNEIYETIYQIFFIVNFEINSVKWMKDLRGRLRKNYAKQTYRDRSRIPKMNYNKHLARKLSELKNIIQTHSLDKSSSSLKTGRKMELQAALEILVLDILSILGESKGLLENNHLFLDENASVLVGKSLRNHLAHDNVLMEILQSDPSIAVLSNALKLLNEDISNSKNRIGKTCSKDLSHVRKVFDHELSIVSNQLDMFTALEKGDFGFLKKCILKGADLFARDTNNRWTALHFAAMVGNLEIVKFLSSSGVDFSDEDIHGRNMLHIAAMYGSSNIVDFILDNKHLQINNFDDSRKTPLHFAAINGQKNVVEILLKYKANTREKDMQGYSPIHHATKNYHKDVVEILLDHQSKTDDLEALGGFTPVHIAAERGHFDMIKFLLERNLKVEPKTDAKATPLHLASLCGHLEIVNLLISKGSDVNARMFDGCTSLHYATENGQENVAEVLLKHGAKPNICDKVYYNTPLHYAAKDGLTNTVENLLKYGANPNCVTVDGTTPLYFAIMNGHLEIVKMLFNCSDMIKNENIGGYLHLAINGGYYEIVELLIKNKADVNEVDTKFDYARPIHIAAGKGHMKILELLIKNKAVVNVRDSDGFTALHLAALCGRWEMIDLLLQNELLIDERSKDGCAPLHCAVKSGKVEAVAILIRNNADVNARTFNGLTPLHVAVTKGFEDILFLLLENHANVHLKAAGMTALHIAAKYGYKRIVEVLLKNGADINIVDDRFQMTPFLFAIKNNQKELVDLLIREGVDINANRGKPISYAIESGNKDIVSCLIRNKARIDGVLHRKIPLLHLAIMNADEDIVRILIGKGIDIHKLKFKGATPLRTSLQLGHENIFRILLNSGAKVHEEITDDGITLLHMAAAGENSEMVQILVDHDIDINVRDIKDRTAFELAVANNRLKNVEILLESGKVNVNEKGKKGLTILHIAAERGPLKMVEYLVDRGAKVDVESQTGSKPAHFAAQKGHRDIVEYFVQRGTSVHDLDTANGSLLHNASIRAQIDVAKYLLEQGADINSKVEEGITPLHVAIAISANVEYVKFLMNNGAFFDDPLFLFRLKSAEIFVDQDILKFLLSTEQLFEAVKENNLAKVDQSIKSGGFVNAKSVDNMTPLHYAAWKGHEKVVDVLLENSANPNLNGRNGFTPLHFASKFSHQNIVKSLLIHGAIYNATSDSGKTPKDIAKNANIINLFKIIDISFDKVQNGKVSVIDDLKKIKDIETIKAVMSTENENKTSLIAIALKNNFSKVKELKEILQDDVEQNESLAKWLCLQERYDEASTVYSKLLKKRKDVLGPNNPGTLDIENKIAAMLYKQHKYDDALNLSKNICLKQIDILGEYDKATLSTKSSIALILHRQGKNHEALKDYRDIYGKQKGILKSDDTDLLNTEFHMALVLNSLKVYDEALEMNKKVYNVCKVKCGRHDSTTLSALNNIAMVLMNQGKYDESLKTYKKVFAARLVVLGPHHSDTLRTMQNIASVSCAKEDYNEALEAYQDIFNIQKQILGPDHYDTLQTENNLAQTYFHQGKHLIAFKMLTNLLPKREAILGPHHPEISETKLTLMTINLKLKYEGILNVTDIILEKHEKNAISAVRNGDIETVRTLIKNQVDVNHSDDDGRSLLHFATDGGHIEIVRMLLESGADVTKASKKGNTPLHIAVLKNYKEVADIFLKHYRGDALVSFVNAKTFLSGTTSLHIAAKNGNVEIVKLLLKNNAAYNIENCYGETPLDFSKDCGIADLLKMIHGIFNHTIKGENSKVMNIMKILDDYMLKVIANTRNDKQMTLVQVALMNKHRELARDSLSLLRDMK